MTVAGDSLIPPVQRVLTEGEFSPYEVALANRNSGMPLEALRHDLTPAGLHFLLCHFDVPFVAAAEEWRLAIAGRVQTPLTLSLAELQGFPQKSLRVTLECAGNGRAHVLPRWQNQPWGYGAVGTAEWTGTALRHLLETAGIAADAVDVAFFGADRGFDANVEHDYGRSLTPANARNDDVLVVWAMNGVPLLPQHGFPLRLVVPGWYGMASVKWLKRIEVLAKPFDGFQQVRGYHYRHERSESGSPVSTMRVKSLMAPPGMPDWYTGHRVVDAGRVELFGRAWSGNGVPIESVAVGIDGSWADAVLDPAQGRYTWCGWRFGWNAESGPHVLECRATDADGNTQPLEPPWDCSGLGNNAVQRVHVTVR